jgi:hypothetical protein
MVTLMQRFPGLRMCWILPGTSMDLNLVGRSAARCRMWRSPSANTSTIVVDRWSVSMIFGAGAARGLAAHRGGSVKAAAWPWARPSPP